MKTKILTPTQKNLKFLGEEIQNGKIVCYKTDTIYGIGANPFLDTAVQKIFNAKKRPDNKPIILLASNNYKIEDLVYVNEKASSIIKKYWPCELTMIFKLKKDTLSKYVTCGFDTVAIRKPNDQICNLLCQYSGGLITSTSANISGQPTQNSPQNILQEFGDGALDYILDSGLCENNLASTLIDATGEEIKILRQGKIIIN